MNKWSITWGLVYSNKRQVIIIPHYHNEISIKTLSLNISRGIAINTLRPRQMAAIFQTTLSNGFSWIKMYEFRLTFHWNLFLRVELTIFQHWFRQWLGAVQATSHYLNQWWLVYRRIYASLGLNELNFVIHSIETEVSVNVLNATADTNLGNIQQIQTFALWILTRH